MNSMDLLYCAACAALAAGKDILDVYLDPNSDFGIEKKADNSPLTIAFIHFAFTCDDLRSKSFNP